MRGGAAAAVESAEGTAIGLFFKAHMMLSGRGLCGATVDVEIYLYHISSPCLLSGRQSLAWPYFKVSSLARVHRQLHAPPTANRFTEMGLRAKRERGAQVYRASGRTRGAS